MKVEFGAMEETAIPGFKGGEGVTHARMFADGCNRIMRGRLEPGCSIGLHTHEGSSEIVYGKRRGNSDPVQRPVIHSSSDVYRIFYPLLCDLPHEELPGG